MNKAILFLVSLCLSTFLQGQNYSKLGHGIEPNVFFHQQNINYYLNCSDEKGQISAIHYDTVSSGFNFGKEFTQIRLKIFDGISWLNTSPIKLYSLNTIDAPRILGIKYYNNTVYICGSFDSSQNNLGAGILLYDGNWKSAGTSIFQVYPDYFEVNSIHFYGQNYLITGNFDSTTGIKNNGMMLYEDGNWKTIGQIGQMGFQGLSGTSNVFFYGADSLYVYNKNKIKPDSIEIGTESIRKLGIWRQNKFTEIPYPEPYIAALGQFQHNLVVFPSSQLVYVNKLSWKKNNQWESFQFPNTDSFYATNYLGSQEIDNLLYIVFQSPTEGIKIYYFDGNEIRLKTTFKIADNYINLEFTSNINALYLSGNFTTIQEGVYTDSFRKIVRIDFIPNARVTGICFQDLNKDKIHQINEPIISNSIVQERNSKTISSSDGKGRYNMRFTPSSAIRLRSSARGISSSSDIIISDIKDSIYQVDLPMDAALVEDVQLKIYCNTSHRVKQGYITIYQVELTNLGTEVQNFQLKMHHDNRVDKKTFNQFNPELVQRDYWLKNVQLEANTIKRYVFECRYSVDSFNLEENVQVRAEISATDDNIKNNTDSINQTVVAAFDPNIKVASPSMILAQNDIIKYVIHFENLGNDTALNVTVVDTIGSLFELSSIVWGGTSHKQVKFRVEKNCL
ncbi:MAG: hypothetical protein IT245_07180, partial [Bacteroidia bacterium]|nr:hypothetical protein [Bacteroidia bacterium]